MDQLLQIQNNIQIYPNKIHEYFMLLSIKVLFVTFIFLTPQIKNGIEKSRVVVPVSSRDFLPLFSLTQPS